MSKGSRLAFFILLLLIDLRAYGSSILGNLEQTDSIKELNTNLNLDKQRQADLERQAVRFVRRDPFVPQKIDYGAELGEMWFKNNLYLLGGNLGYHLGECVFSHSPTCQQYLDFLINSTGRAGYTYTNLLASVRWQFVNFPSSWSPLFRLYAGEKFSMTPDGSSQNGAAGIGVGMATYLHPRADIRFEARLGISEQIYGQAIVSIQIKADRWLDFFARKLKDVGVGTATVTGAVLKTTVNTTGKAIGAGSETPTDAPAKKGEGLSNP